MEITDLKIKPEYMALKMQVRDIKYAFSLAPKTNVQSFIYNTLIADGLMQKYNERYFLPTDKLLEYIFVPSFYITSREQRRALVVQNYFSKDDLITIFGGGLRGLVMFRAMIRNGFVFQDDGKRYRLETSIGERLADGVEVIPITRVWETKEVEIGSPKTAEYVEEGVQEEATERSGLLGGRED